MVSQDSILLQNKKAQGAIIASKRQDQIAQSDCNAKRIIVLRADWTYQCCVSLGFAHSLPCILVNIGFTHYQFNASEIMGSCAATFQNGVSITWC